MCFGSGTGETQPSVASNSRSINPDMDSPNYLILCRIYREMLGLVEICLGG